MKKQPYETIAVEEDDASIHDAFGSLEIGTDEYSTDSTQYKEEATSNCDNLRCCCLKGKWLVLAVLLVVSFVILAVFDTVGGGHILFVVNKHLYAVNKHIYPLPEGVQPSNFSFPSVEERVQYYMSSWYDIPDDYVSGQNKSSKLCPDIKLCNPGKRVLTRDVPLIETKECLMNAEERGYDKDALSFLEHLKPDQLQKGARIIMMVGDRAVENPEHPIVVKSRYSKEGQPSLPVTSQDIVVYMHGDRHYGPVKSALNYYDWIEKKETVVFRGADTGGGKRSSVIQQYNQIDKYSLDDINVAFSLHAGNQPKISYDPSKSRPLYRGYISQGQMLQYKYLLVIEGNDVSTGLKWMLFSNSVVFMSKPTRVSWAMEDLLVPYVHYVPLKDDHSDLMEQLEWAREHDEECELISKQATQYMYDLHMNEQAGKDKDEILSRMVQRYYDNYQRILLDC